MPKYKGKCPDDKAISNVLVLSLASFSLIHYLLIPCHCLLIPSLLLIIPNFTYLLLDFPYLLFTQSQNPPCL